MQPIPVPPNPSDPLRASFGRAVVAALRERTVRAGPGLYARTGPGGTVIGLAAAPEPAGGGGRCRPAVVTGAAVAGLVPVEFRDNGFSRPATGRGYVALTDTSLLSAPAPGTLLLAQGCRTASHVISDEAEPEEEDGEGDGEGDEEGDEEGPAVLGTLCSYPAIVHGGGALYADAAEGWRLLYTAGADLRGPGWVLAKGRPLPALAIGGVELARENLLYNGSPVFSGGGLAVLYSYYEGWIATPDSVVEPRYTAGSAPAGDGFWRLNGDAALDLAFPCSFSPQGGGAWSGRSAPAVEWRWEAVWAPRGGGGASSGPAGEYGYVGTASAPPDDLPATLHVWEAGGSAEVWAAEVATWR